MTTAVNSINSLKSAIATGNSDGVDDIITFTGNIIFSNASDSVPINVTDGHTMTIVGGGNTLNGNNMARVMTVGTNGAGSAVVIQNLTITNGFVTGNGGNAGANGPDLNDVGKPGDDAKGAGIWNSGVLTISNSTITNNKASAGGGAGGLTSGNGGGGGGGGGYGSSNGGNGGSSLAYSHPGAPGTAGAGGNGGPLSGQYFLLGGKGGTTTGGNGSGGFATYSRGGNGGTANAGGGLSIGGGGGGGGADAKGGAGGNAVGGIYNIGTLTISGSSITNNIGAGGGGGGGSKSDIGKDGGAGGNGVGGIWNNGGTVTLDSATNNSLATGNRAGAGAGGYADSGSSPGADGIAYDQKLGTFTILNNPTITNVTSSKLNGSYPVGTVIQIQITFSETVTVTGTPQLLLETGVTDRMIHYVSGSTSSTLTFTYTVQAGDTNADLDYNSTTALSLNGGTIKSTSSGSDATLTLFSPGAANSLGANKNIVIDTTAPAAPSAPDMTAGTDNGVSNTDNLTSSTTPMFTGTAEAGSIVTLYDTDGTTALGTATATGGSYSITSSTLSAGGHTLTAKATDAAGNVSVVSTGLAVTIDTTAPTVNSVSVPANATYIVGQNLDFTLNLSENVTVTGSPKLDLTLDTGGTVAATYLSGSGSNALVFRYTVVNGNLDTNGVSLGANIALNGGSLKDTAGNDATLTLNSVGALSNVLVDGVVPTVSSINRTGAAITNATSVSYTVTFSESVTGVDSSDFVVTPTGGVTGNIASVTGSGNAYTVTVNGITGDGTLRLDLKNAGTGIADAASNAIATGYTTGQVYTLDTTAPTVSSVAAPANASYIAGQHLDFTVNLSENVTVTGSPKIDLTLDTGGTVAATYLSGSGTNALVFRYTVVSGNLDTNGVSLGGNIVLNGGTLKDGAGNNATLTLNSVGALTGVLVDGVAPTVNSVSVPANATYSVGQNLDFTLNLSENVTVAGSPKLDLTLDTGGTVAATYLSGSGTNALVFRYTVAGGNLDTNGVSLGANIVLNGGSLKDTAGNDATLTLNSVGALTNVLVDGVVPTISSINCTGAIITNATSVGYTVTFSESVTGVDTNDFVMTATGGVTGTIASVTGSGTTYTVTVNGITGDGTLRLDLKNAGTGIADAASNSIATGYTAGQEYTLDTTAPAAPSTPDMTAGTDTGVSNTDNITSNTTPAFTGTAEANSTVKLYDTDGVTLLGTSTANGAGNWTLTSSALAVGSHTVKATATDAAGNISALSTGLTITIATPTITSVSYDAATGILTVTGTGMVTNDTIDVSKLTLSGETSGSYTLTAATPNPTAASATSFIVTLGAADKLAINGLLNNNGTSAVSGTTFNLTGALNWDSTAGAAADATNAVTVSNVAAPTITSATYDVNTHVLTVTGTGLVSTLGATNDITVTALTIKGEGGIVRTLSTTGNVEVTSATSFAVTLAGADQTTVEGLFNKNGTTSTGGTTYNLAAADDWDSVITGGDIAVTTAPITVSNVAVPTITSSVYNASTGVLTVTGTGLTGLTGANNDIVANKFSLQGEGGASYTLTTTSNVEITSATSFTMTLSAADRLGANLIMNKNGTSSTSVNTYNLIANEDWNAGADAAVVIADLTGNGVTVTNVVAPTVASATYNVGTGVLVVTGNNFLSLAGANNDITANRIRFLGQGAINYTLTTSPNIDITSNTSFTMTMSVADKTQLALRLNKDGNSSTDGTTYNIGMLEDWNTGAATAVVIADLFGNFITVTGNNVAPVIGGVVAGQTVTETTTVSPFTGVTITDPDVGASETIIISLDTAAKGAFTAASLATTGFSTADGGLTYTHAAGTPAAVEAAIRGLVFQPAAGRVPVGGTETTTFTISANDGIASAVLNNTTTVIATGVNAAPTNITLSNAAVQQGSADNTSVGTLTAIDPNPGDTASFTLVSGNGTNDKDNSKFTISGNTLVAKNPVGMTPGNYSIFVRATDAMGSAYEKNFIIAVGDNVAPTATGITRIQPENTSLGTIDYKVTFSEAVTGVNAAAFALATTGTVAGTISNVTQLDPSTYSVRITGLTGDGTLGLNLKNAGTGIVDTSSLALNGGFTGQLYQVDHTAPTTTIANLKFSNDDGISGTDFVTTATQQTISGTLSASLLAGETVQVSLDNGTNWINATATVGSNSWALQNQTVSGNNTLKVRVSDLAGNSGAVLQQAYSILAYDNNTGTNPSDNTIPVIDPDADSDGILQTIEAEVPNWIGSGKGDGNGDGKADQAQKEVGSLLWNNGGLVNTHYATLSIDSSLALSHTTTSASPLNLPSDLQLQYGLINSQINGVGTGKEINLSVYTDKLGSVNGYWVQDKAGNWTNIASAITEVNGKLKVDFKITDGGIFDADGKVDGKISFSGGLGYRNSSLPGDKDGDGIPDAIEARVGTKLDVKDNDVLHRSDLFAMQLYRDVLFREADAAGVQYWQQQIDSGKMSRAQVAASFMESAEFQSGIGGITRLYFGAFDRLPDREGLAYWMQAQKDGMNLSKVSASFVSSAEFQKTYGALDNTAFVDRVYQNVLHRSSDAAGKAYWLGQLGNGLSRGDMLAGFTESSEFKANSQSKVSLTLDYIGLLGHAPDQATFDALLAQSGTDVVTLIGQFINSPEYLARFMPV
ncbi:Ig-like domain-containing protein [Undibacterium sp. KW1]|uniref:DUF4214 domain-containing protein n=1 Tax=Undibacterium sp. KW1 TaxID=2058624 RepID=UPI001389596C|nr:Ig-like domain-containing protein [Undibacterium sp. KW1]